MFESILNAVRTPSRTSRRGCPRHRPLRAFEMLEAREMMTAVPAYASLPGAPVTVYLDFDGHHEDHWGELEFAGNPDAETWDNVNTPKFNLDWDNRHFSDLEKQFVHQIWQCVAEDFAPFNINVTTVEPPASELAHTIRVCIGGGSLNWYGELAGGISVQGSFPNQDLANVVYVFSDEFSNARSMADVASQEVGHSLGLDHQRIWNNGQIIEEYNPGTPESAPIMGESYYSQRSLWWRDEHAENGWTKQDDMHLMTLINQGVLEYRADDHGNSVGTATYITDFNYTTNGVITQNGRSTNTYNDRDAFIVTLPGTSVMKHWVASVEVNNFSANLDAKLEVYKFSYTPGGKYTGGKTPPPPTFMGFADPGADLNAIFDLGAGGSFMIVVSSHGGYGDLGQYSLKFYNVDVPLVNTNPVTLPPIIDIICDPLLPVVQPGPGLVGNAVLTAPTLNSQLNLLAASAVGTTDGAAKTGNLNDASNAMAGKTTAAKFAALDEAFADLGGKLLVKKLGV